MIRLTVNCPKGTTISVIRLLFDPGQCFCICKPQEIHTRLSFRHTAGQNLPTGPRECLHDYSREYYADQVAATHKNEEL